MGSTTSKGYPYPVGTDRVMDGDDAIKSLAEKVDAALGVQAAGQVSCPVAAASTTYTVTITFPAGRFTAAPIPVCTPLASTLNTFEWGFSTPTTSSVVLNYKRGGATNFTMFWAAIQV